MIELRTRNMLMLFAIATLATISVLSAQDRERDAATELIKLSDLPNPPDEIAELIKQGSVKFFVGQRPDSGAEDRGGGRNRVIAAETHFQLSFDYRSRTKWRVHESGSTAKLVITASFQNVKLKRDHEVWFRQRPEPASFWENRLVLHEFDHVRLSSNPGIEKRFVQQLRDNNVITDEITSDTRVTTAMIRRLVTDHAKQVFDKTVDLVNIRYQELDRQTDHGIKPLPEDSSLSEWLR